MKLFQQIYNSPKLIISKVQGDAIAGGCGLITVCDLIIAADSSRFGYTEVNIGFVPAIVSQFLINRIGVSKSKELLLTGKILSAQEAKEIGLINHSIKKDNLENYVITLATHLIQETSEKSIALTKELTNKLSQKDLEWAAEINAKSRENNDFKKGIESFLNKEKISW
jgi:methylglutaconyl-CoA hydratase